MFGKFAAIYNAFVPLAFLDMVVTFRGTSKGNPYFCSRRSDFVTGEVNRDFWSCGSFADFVAGAVLCGP